MTHADPPDEPPETWWRRDIERRLEANEKRMGAEIEANIHRDALITGEFGLVAAVKANTIAIKENTDALAADRVAAVKAREAAAEKQEAMRVERAQFMRRTALSLAISLLLIVATVLITGALS